MKPGRRSPYPDFSSSTGALAIYVSFNWVLGLDGGAIDRNGGSAELSSTADRARMSRIRAEADAVLVGAATIRGEDPSLAVDDADACRARVEAGRPEQPRPVVLTASGRLDPGARIFASGEPRPLVLTAPGGMQEARSLGDRADVAVLPEGAGAVEGALSVLAEAGVKRVLVEGGATVVRSFVRAGRVDEVNLTLSPRLGARLPGEVTPSVLDELLELELAQVERDGAFLFLRYRRGEA